MRTGGIVHRDIKTGNVISVERAGDHSYSYGTDRRLFVLHASRTTPDNPVDAQADICLERGRAAPVWRYAHHSSQRQTAPSCHCFVCSWKQQISRSPIHVGKKCSRTRSETPLTTFGRSFAKSCGRGTGAGVRYHPILKHMRHWNYEVPEREVRANLISSHVRTDWLGESGR